jgi:steroid delta-isomerase-like uncharacterized protein
MANEMIAVVHEWFDRVWNQGQREAIDEMLTEDACIHGLQGTDGCDVPGHAEFKQMHEGFREVFPNLNIAVEECVSEDDRVAFRCTVRGTHAGSGLGIAATGREVEFAGMGFVRIREGKIAEAWNVFDFQAMNAQLGPPSDA